MCSGAPRGVVCPARAPQPAAPGQQMYHRCSGMHRQVGRPVHMCCKALVQADATMGLGLLFELTIPAVAAAGFRTRCCGGRWWRCTCVPAPSPAWSSSFCSASPCRRVDVFSSSARNVSAYQPYLQHSCSRYSNRKLHTGAFPDCCPGLSRLSPCEPLWSGRSAILLRICGCLVRRWC